LYFSLFSEFRRYSDLGFIAVGSNLGADGFLWMYSEEVLTTKRRRDRMNFQALQESLRKLVADRIRRREFTGLSLATKAGVRQGHISNFLSRRRGMSVEVMDRILHLLQVSVMDLLDPAELKARAGVARFSEDWNNVPLVDAAAAPYSPIPHSAVHGYLKHSESFLRRLRVSAVNPQEAWPRFLCIKVDAENASAMSSCISPGSILLVDRHYTSLRPYRRTCRNIYAVHVAGRMLIRYIELHDGTLVLRPESPQLPVHVLLVGKSGSLHHDQIIGRICQVSREL
jgi:hypothetical protein